MREIMTRILEQAINAPSGSNSQPWHFQISNNIITVLADPRKDHPIFNYHNRGTLIAHGALIENILILSHAAGYQTVLETPNQPNSDNVTARITLTPGDTQEQELASSIPHRSTNRKKYEKLALPAADRDALIESANKIPGIEIFVAEHQKKISNIAATASVNEILMFGNKSLRGIFLDEILWDSTKADAGAPGLFIETMELKLPQRLLIRTLSLKPLAALAKMIGLGRKVASENAENYASCSAIFLFLANNSDNAYINIGRSMERLWLTAISRGYSAHMLTGLLFLYQQITFGDDTNFDNDEKILITKTYEELRGEVGLKNDKDLIGMMLRVGKSDPPAGISKKLKPLVIFS